MTSQKLSYVSKQLKLVYIHNAIENVHSNSDKTPPIEKVSI